MSGREARRSERCTRVTGDSARARARASRVALSPPPITTTGRPANRSRIRPQLVGHVSAEGPIGGGG